MSSGILVDSEFGDMLIRRSARARSVRIRVGTDGRYVISAPRFTPIAWLRLTVSQSRDELRRLRHDSAADHHYAEGDVVSQRHVLAVVHTGMVAEPTTKIVRERLIVQLPSGRNLDEPSVQQLIRDAVITILRREAKAALPSRLAAMAQQHGHTYERVRFSHSGGRWGSCSSTGTISLNIALMRLPDELIDYVLAHELSHTRQMNHSVAFWREVAQIDPHYALHRQQLRAKSPVV